MDLSLIESDQIRIFELNREWNKMTPYEFWNEIGNPKYVCAPMVDQSELPFRMIARKYGAELTFTPMIDSWYFNSNEKHRKLCIDDIYPGEQPCFAQFAGNDPELLLKCAKLIENKVPCIDLNLGCPKGRSTHRQYGCYLLEREDKVLQILSYLSNNLKCGVSCKIRTFNDLERTYEYVKKIEETGIKVLTVHGRHKKQLKHLIGDSDWNAIKIIKDSVKIPVIANGNIGCKEDIERCFNLTNCDAVMSAEKILEDPSLFSEVSHNVDDIVIEYLELAKKFKIDRHPVKFHLMKFYYTAWKKEHSIFDKIINIKNFDGYLKFAKEIKEMRKDIKNEDKFGWYMRFRNDEKNTQSNNNGDDCLNNKVDNLNSKKEEFNIYNCEENDKKEFEITI